MPCVVLKLPPTSSLPLLHAQQHLAIVVQLDQTAGPDACDEKHGLLCQELDAAGCHLQVQQITSMLVQVAQRRWDVGHDLRCSNTVAVMLVVSLTESHSPKPLHSMRTAC
jgi:hypothetical protein